MRVTVLLTDAASVADGKLYVHGGGYTETVVPSRTVIALIFELGPDELWKAVEWELTLHEWGGAPFIPSGMNEPALVRGGFSWAEEVPQVHHAEIARVPVVVPISPLALPAPGLYEWRVTANGESRPDWGAGFTAITAEMQRGFET
jgi:hypothetical protein